MGKLDIIYEEHREMIRFTNALLEAAAATPASAETIAGIRYKLGQFVSRHVANKHAIVTAALQESTHPEHRILCRIYVEDLFNLRQNTAEHYGYWTIERLMDDLHGYRLALRQQLRLLKTRIDWEEREVLPIVALLAASPRPISEAPRHPAS